MSTILQQHCSRGTSAAAHLSGKDAPSHPEFHHLFHLLLVLGAALEHVLEYGRQFLLKAGGVRVFITKLRPQRKRGSIGGVHAAERKGTRQAAEVGVCSQRVKHRADNFAPRSEKMTKDARHTVRITQ